MARCFDRQRAMCVFAGKKLCFPWNFVGPLIGVVTVSCSPVSNLQTMTQTASIGAMRTLTDLSPNRDHADLVRVRNGDSAAFAEIVQRHARQAYSIARAILDNHADADDAVQES